ncbi:glycosyltransferase [Thermomonas sp.]|uniref:glycosyltransferase n=1 Tax=Thermomonas sp. TaxID=1971895 RepID=UPI002488E3AD|nr:glycosyltransferase [Thermomonas sp.]MDI1254017.1 glycosyltransferase [Thermomonas sp.]
MSTLPAITVLVLVRSDAAFLPAALDSLRAQSMDDWSALLCPIGEAARDAASTQAAIDPRIHVEKTSATVECEALVQAATTVDSEFLCVLDGDDLLEPTALAMLLEALHADSAAGMSYSRHVLVDANDHPLGPGPLCELAYSPQALLLDFMTGPLRLMRMAAYREAGGHRDAHPDAIEYDLCLRLSETTGIVHVPLALYRRRIHPQAPEVARWAEGIEARYNAFVDAVKRRGIDATHDHALHIDSWHILQPLRPFGGVGNWR